MRDINSLVLQTPSPMRRNRKIKKMKVFVLGLTVSVVLVLTGCASTGQTLDRYGVGFGSTAQVVKGVVGIAAPMNSTWSGIADVAVGVGNGADNARQNRKIQDLQQQVQARQAQGSGDAGTK